MAERSEKALLIAHRGAHNNAQGLIENTLDAFKRAKEVGCWGIECDVHVTKDNVIVVNHDPTLKRLWNHDVAISSLTFEDLRALEPNIPSLSEVVEQFGHSMHLFIELKAPFNNEDILAELLKDLEPCKNYHLLALDAQTFKDCSQFPLQSLLLVAVHNNVNEFCDLAIKKNYGGVLGSYLLLTNKHIKELKTASQSYGVGFVDSKFSLYRELNRGINWIFTNQAMKVSGYLNELKIK